MTIILRADNVFDYLLTRGLVNQNQESPTNIEPLTAKNFNLLLSFTDNNKLLVKQERLNRQGLGAGEFFFEWRIQEFLQRFPEMGKYRQFLPEVIDFDRENSIIVGRYLDDYQDLMAFYDQEKKFPLKIAAAVGSLLGDIHRDTFNRPEYQEFFAQDSDSLN